MAMSLEKQQQTTQLRRKQIIDAAMELFDQNGYSNTKISDITKKAGISKGLTYRYFTSKEEIVTAVLDRVDACITECANVEDAVEAITLFTRRLLSYPCYEGYVPSIRVFFTALMREEVHLEESLNPISEEFGRDYFGKLFKRGQKQGYFRDGDPELFGDMYWKSLIGYMGIMKVHKNETKYNPDVDKMLSVFKK